MPQTPNVFENVSFEVTLMLCSQSACPELWSRQQMGGLFFSSLQFTLLQLLSCLHWLPTDSVEVNLPALKFLHWVDCLPKQLGLGGALSWSSLLDLKSYSTYCCRPTMNWKHLFTNMLLDIKLTASSVFLFKLSALTEENECFPFPAFLDDFHLSPWGFCEI